MKLATIFASLTILLLFSSCSRYIDKVSSLQSIPVKQGYFNFYSDSNVLVYTSDVGLTRDTEKVYPKHFRISLPKGIKYYELTGSTDFSIYYDSKQVILIRLDLEKNIIGDRMYVLKNRELESFIQSGMTLKNFKYNIKTIDVNDARRNVIIRKGAATILLYNIKLSKYDLFYKSATTFSFIKN